MLSIKLSNGRKFTARSGESILDAGLASSISLSYSCKTGRCGVCKCKVLKGETIALKDETGLSDLEKAEGWILGCVRSAQTDITLKVEDLGDFTLPPVKTFPCRISSLDHLASDVIRVTLRLPPAADFRFIPGQYIDIIGPEGIRRSYSLAKAGLTDKTLELNIRSVDGGLMSNYWFNQARCNDLLRLNGPLGTFFLRNVQNLNLVFLATGTGIAPIKAILESLVDIASDQIPKSVTVFWGGRTASDLYIDLQSVLLADQHFVPVLSRPNSKWSGVKGYVQDALLATSPDFSSTVVYACGSNNMIRSAKAKFLAAGLPENRFFADAFVPSGT
jgi:CDP-4-dehydro-6-deoxyglucose reductase